MKNLPTISCTGCSTCANRCPQHCIIMKADTEGFLFPSVDETKCINCKLCEKVCPILTVQKTNPPQAIFIGRNTNLQIVQNSSSGGIFTLLAQHTITAGGVVFGAMFDKDWNVVHGYIEKEEDIFRIRGSKYVQSKIGNVYNDVKRFLKDGRQVLFSGTPCQIAGLKSFLKKQYNNLLTIDFICHGVPSPIVWKKYLKENINSLYLHNKCQNIKDNIFPSIDNISFRDKKIGWKEFCLTISFYNPTTKKEQTITSKPLNDDLYLKGFLSNLYLRKSCHQCSFKSWKSGSDITIADAWGVNYVYPQYNDNKGYSLVIILSDKGRKIVAQLKENISIIKEPINEDYIKKHNNAAYQSVHPHKNRKKFFKLLNKSNRPLTQIITTCLPPPSYIDKIIWSVNKRLNKFCKLWK